MSPENLHPKKINTLIDQLMQTKDPATVGLRKILKSKKQSGEAFPLKTHHLEEMSTASKGQKVFSDDEKKIISLERENLNLKEEVKKLKAEMEQKAKESYQKGHDVGKASGSNDGENIAEEKFNRKLEAIEQKVAEIIGNVEISRNAVLKQAHRIVLEISLEIARKIINTEVATNDDIVIYVIKKAISHIVDKHGFVVRVAPDDFSNVMSKKEAWTSISQRLEDISIEEDERIEKGGCIIESESGAADARIDVQVAEMAEVIATAWESSLAGDIDTEELEADEMEEPEVKSEEIHEPIQEQTGETDPDEENQGPGRFSGISQDQIDSLFNKVDEINDTPKDNPEA